MSTLKATNLQHASATSPNITLGSDGSVAVGGGNISPQTGFRNRVINGGMVIDQRNAGASVNNSGDVKVYTLDRFGIYGNQNSKFSVQQSSTAPAGFSKSLRVTSSSAYSVPSGETFTVSHAIEGNNISDLSWGTANAKTVTLSFQVYSSLTGTFGGAISNGNGDRSYPFSFTVSSANTWTPVAITIAGDQSGTWATDNSTGMVIYWSMGAGSTYSGTAGAWAGALYVSATGATSVVGTNGATFYLTGVQLEKGTVATPFEFRSIGQELALCQRYYEKSYNPTDLPGTVTAAGSSQIEGAPYTVLVLPIFFKTTKRADPTLTIYSTKGASGKATITGDVDITAITQHVSQQGFSCGGSSGSSFQWIRFQYTASAEL